MKKKHLEGQLALQGLNDRIFHLGIRSIREIEQEVEVVEAKIIQKVLAEGIRSLSIKASSSILQQ